MKISIEFKEKKYTVIFGKLSGTGSSPKEAVDNLIQQFGDQIRKLFQVS